MIRKVLGPLFFVVLFNVVAVGLLLMTPPWFGIVWALLLGVAFLGWHLRKRGGWGRRRARIRIRAPKASFGRVALACVSTLLLLFGIAGLISVFGRPLRPEDLRGYQILAEYQKTATGWIAFTMLIALVIPVVEEFSFRGRMQYSLERRYGLLIALGVTSLLFTITHIGVPRSAILLIPLTLGLANGVAVNVFNSIWVAVATHSLWNGTMAVLGALQNGAAATRGEASTTSPFVAAVLLLLGATGWWLILRGRQLRTPKRIAAET